MQSYTLNDLMRLTRSELFALYQRIVTNLPELPEPSPERWTALTTLRDIRRVLARPQHTPS